VLGKDLGHHGAGHRPFTANAHGHEEPQADKVPRLLREGLKEGEQGVHEDREDHRPHAAHAIAEHAEAHAPKAPPARNAAKATLL